MTNKTELEVMNLVSQQTSGIQKLKVLFELSPEKAFIPSYLQEISGIRDWTRTIREIRSKYGINIKWVQPTSKYPYGYYMNKILK
ncbi:MAG: hypothetical protein Q9M28_02975 [Mariprofundaceae bacterium]|nr:hypothetical protein [Mariprofundaceae bacterium]